MHTDTLFTLPDLPALPDISLPEISLSGLMGTLSDSLAGTLDNMLPGLYGAAALPEWYLMDEWGNIPITFTSFISMELRAEGRAVSTAVEEGSFASYNKVNSPLSINCTLGFMGDDAALQYALHLLTIFQEDTFLLSLVTPNAEYENLNLVAYSYQRRRENGLGMLYVDLQLEEIRQVEAQYTNVKLAPRKNRGLIQAKTATPDQKKQVAAGAGKKRNTW